MYRDVLNAEIITTCNALNKIKKKKIKFIMMMKISLLDTTF